MLKHIDIQNVTSGMVIVKVTEQNGPIKIKKSGLVTSQDMVQGLIEMGVQQVAIDPDQTVEVEAPKIKKSATRRMLESNKVTHSRIDDSVSEQFNRSLFLPSVEGIPSAWQFYAKRYLFAAFITLGGLGFGWSLGNYQGVITLLSPEPDKPAASVVAPVPAMAAPASEPLENQTAAPKSTEELAAATEVISQNSETTDVAPVITSIPEPEPEPHISADVLSRFRKAINEVEGAPTTAAPVEKVPNSQDVPRVDQLPPWVMTRLPSMAFSAHMYASVDSERWVRVNGTRMVEGDKIDGVIEIVRIEPQRVILNYSGQTFSMAALTDW